MDEQNKNLSEQEEKKDALDLGKILSDLHDAKPVIELADDGDEYMEIPRDEYHDLVSTESEYKMIVRLINVFKDDTYTLERVLKGLYVPSIYQKMIDKEADDE